MKTQPVGVCDHCLGPIPARDWYTRRGPRRYCSIDCKNTANSRAGAPIRSAKQKSHVAAGEWQNPAKLHPPTGAEQAERARKGRLREVREGRWRNPALPDTARAKLSIPRKHQGALASAIEKLRTMSVADLTPEEQESHRAYRREKRRNLWQRMTESQRDHYREIWRASYHRNKKPRR